MRFPTLVSQAQEGPKAEALREKLKQAQQPGVCMLRNWVIARIQFSFPLQVFAFVPMSRLSRHQTVAQYANQG
jgi:hypothetical protein